MVQDGSGSLIDGQLRLLERLGWNWLLNWMDVVIKLQCFMNSVLQCLSNTRAVLDYVISEEYTRNINTTTSSMNGALIKGSRCSPLASFVFRPLHFNVKSTDPSLNHPSTISQPSLDHPSTIPQPSLNHLSCKWARETSIILEDPLKDLGGDPDKNPSRKDP